MTDPELVRDGDVVLVDRTADRAPGVAADDRGPAGPVAFGRERLREAVAGAGGTVTAVDYWSETERSSYLVVGRPDDSVVGRLLADVDASLDRPEGVVFRWCATPDGTALVVAGTDARGLAYALHELADRVAASGPGALSAVADTVEFPDNAVRGVDRYVMGPVADGWLYDEGFWHDYLARLVRCRFNRLVLIAGYDSAFLSPPYPFVVDVPGFPDVRVADDVPVDREATRAAIRRVGALCERYGLEFELGVWQQQPWLEVQGQLVEGLPTDDAAFASYCAAGIESLLTACPEIDRLQLRINHEAGVREDREGDPVATAESFWRPVLEGVERAAAARERPLGLDVRAKGLTDRLLDWAQETGLDLAVPTKFSWEATGLPYHTTRLRRPELDNLDDPDRARRYSYASLLASPRPFDVLYRLWMVGTNRVFLWGDPDYARRFSRAAGFGDAAGFEVAAPMSLKGGHYGLQDEAWPLHADPDLRHYEHEDERYWAWYWLLGRLGYDADAGPSVTRRPFRARFGEAADAVLTAYRAASAVLPLVTSAHLTQHPAQHNWAELDTGGALFAEHNVNPMFADRGTTYQDVEPGDPGLFYGVSAYVADREAGDLEPKYTPPQVARWYEWFADRARAAIAAAEAQLADPGAEFAATTVDVHMVADLADVHTRKTRAAVALATYRETGDEDALRDAHAHADRAVAAWRSLADRGDAAYHDDLVFALGPSRGDAGAWGDRLPELEADRDRLGDMLDEAGLERPATPPDGDGAPPTTGGGRAILSAPERCRPGEAVPVTVDTDAFGESTDLWLYYRHADQTEGSFRRVAMAREGGAFRAAVPADYVVPEWDLLVYAAGIDERGDGVVVPGLYAPDSPAPYRVVAVEPDA